MDRARRRGEGPRPRRATDATHRRSPRRGSDRTLLAAPDGGGEEMRGAEAAVAEAEPTSADAKDAGPAVQ